MRFALASAILAIGAATSAFADDIPVTVEPTAFNPTNVTAQPGDTITFTFISKNHTVTQSSFDSPCQPLDGGIDSGFEPIPDNSTETLNFTITINDTSAIFFYCRQTGHCSGDGQVFAVNLPANETYEEFQAAANASGTTSSNSTSNSTSPSSTSSKKPSSTGSSPSSSSSSSSSSSAMRTGAQAGGLLAAIGFVASFLL